MRNSSEIIGLPILCIKEGITYGQVKEFLINPDEGKIDFIVLDNGFWYSGALVIPYSSIYGIGSDAVTTPSIEDICAFSGLVEAQKLVDRGVLLKGTRIYTVNGQYMGTLSEYAIRVGDGKIVGCTMSSDEGDVFIASEQIMTFGRDVIILRESEQDEDAIEPIIDLIDGGQSDISLEYENIQERIKIVDVLVPDADADADTDTDTDTDTDADTDTDTDTEQEESVRSVEEVEFQIDDSESSNDEVRPSEDLESEENSAAIMFEQRQRKFLIGRKASKSILDDEGIVLVKVNQEITDELIDIVKIHGRLIELTMNTKL